MITVHLHGPFKDFHPGPIKLAVSTTAEAVKALSYQVPGFKPDARGQMKSIRVVGKDTIEDIAAPLKDGEELHVVPDIFLSGGPKSQVVIGTLLLAAAFLLPLGPFWAPVIASMGVSMVIGGVMQLLAPQQKLSSDEEERSRYLGSPPNTVGIGTPIGILLGEDLVQGHLLSSDIDAAEVA